MEFKIEHVFYIPTRGCAIMPIIPEDADFRIRAKDDIELHTPDGRIIKTHIASIELVKRDGPSRIAIMLPSDVSKQDIPAGTEIRFL